MNLNRQILRLALPAILSNITVPLLGLSDTAISGHLGSEVFIAAISVGSLMITLLFYLLGFLRMGTTGLTANAFGAGDVDGVRGVFSRSLVVALLMGGIFILCQDLLLDGLMALIGAEDAVREPASSYFRICIYEIPALLGIMAISGWFIGMQSTFWPMVISISVNVINIVTSFLLVFPLEVGFEGVAYGTLASNWIGFAMSLVLARRIAPEGRLWIGWREIADVDKFKRFFGVNSNLLLRSACVMSVTLAMSAFGARLGSLTLAANAVMLQFFTFFAYFIDGFAYTAEAMCGKYYGARDRDGLKRIVKLLLKWSAGVASLFFVVYTVSWEGVTSLLTDVDAVRDCVADYHVWIQLIPPLTVLAFIYDGFFIGVTRTGSMLLATAIATVVFFAVTWLFLGGDNNVLWLAFMGYLFMRGAVLALIWRFFRVG